MPVLVLPFPAIDPVLVSFGPFAIRWYALAYVAGILLGWLYARTLIGRSKLWGGQAPLTVVDFDDFILWVTLGIILGGRTGYVLFYNLPHFAEHPGDIIRVWEGGMSFHGGFIGCVLAVVLFAWKRGINFLSLGDLTCAAAPIGICLGRIANFINGELWGRVTDVSWAMVFPGAGPDPRHPSQIYESALEGVLLFVLLAIAIRAGALRRPGLVIGLFAMIYAVARSFCELFREPDPQLGFLFGDLTMGILLSVPLFAAGAAFAIVAMRRPELFVIEMTLNTLPLKLDIQKRIRAAGPMPVVQYMELCLTHPRYGYYSNLDPFGTGGDFTTSPEISQMFGELIGLWSASVWTAMGEPSSINLVELGPGRGTMMADIMRAAKILPAFRQAINIHLVEMSRTLRERQKESLSDVDRPIFWHSMLQDVPRAPSIYLANEFFDALPVNQMVRQADGWHERTIDINEYGDFKFAIGRNPVPRFEQTVPRALQDASIGSIFEWRSPVAALELGRRLQVGGAALIIDYGHLRSAIGDTLQAVRRHRFDDPLTGPGLADLSAHVDFQMLAMNATSFGAHAHGAVDQGSFLVALGIDKRAAALKVNATPEVAAAVGVALERLIAPNQTGMGAMFKVLGLSHPGIPILPGFDSRATATKAA